MEDSISLKTIAELDQQQVVEHLRSLGYKLTTPIYLRCFPPQKGTARNLQGTLSNFPWAAVQNLQNQGYGIYFVVNGQGHKDADVLNGNVMFFEHDDLDKEQQRNLWRSLNLPEPTLQVDTGGKSIHSYWRLALPCSIENWRELQADLLEFAQADRSIKNPSRVMRLVGSVHQGTGHRATIVSNSGTRHTYEALRAIVPRRHSSQLIPLENCLTRDDRALIQQGAPQGQRNQCGAKLARNLIGTENYLQSIGQQYVSTARSLFESYCSRCNPPIADKELEQIWKSAAADHPTPSLTENAIANCIAAWKSNQPGVLLPVSTQSIPALTLGQTDRAIRELLQQGLSGARLQAEKIAVRSQTSIPEREFNELWQAIDREVQQQESREETKEDLSTLLEIGRCELNLREILNPPLAALLERQAVLLGSTPAAMLLTLLPVVASLARVGTKLELIQATGFYALPILYTGIVCESGGAKSPTQKTILKPLFELQAEADQLYNQQLQDYEESVASDVSEKLTRPVPREYVTQDVTREAIALIQSQQIDRGFLGWLDELSAVIGSQNAYRNGKGTDREALLTGRDGTGLKVNRASGKRLSVPMSAYSITGGTQPDTLRGLMGDFSDGFGQWARFLWCLMPIARSPYPNSQDANTAEQITALLFRAYQRIEAFEPVTYKLTPSAQKLYRQWYETLDERRVQESRQAFRSVYAKAKGNTGELALLLHLLNTAMLGELPTHQISSDTLKAAIRVMQFCLGQVHLIHSLSDEAMGEVSPVMARIIELSDRKGWITAKDVKNGIRSLKKMPPDQIRTLFSEIVQFGHGETEGKGIKVKFRSYSVDKVDLSRQVASTAETLAQIDFAETVDKVATFPGQSQNSLPSVYQLASTETAQEANDKGSQAVDTAEIERLPMSTASTKQVSDLQVGDRIVVNYLSDWHSAILTAIPNHHPNPSKRTTGWKAKLDSGRETFIWDACNICPL